MDESPEAVQSMDGDRSLNLFGWFLLPLLSLCSCRRRDANCAQRPMQATPIYWQPRASPTDLSIASDFEAPIRSRKMPLLALSTILRSRPIDNTDSSSSDQLKLTDLPLLALLSICAHLRPKNGSETSCKDLYRLRNTCRTFAYVVNSFFENPANLPPVMKVFLAFRPWLGVIHMDALMQSVNYLMHPLRGNRTIFPSFTANYSDKRHTFINASFDINSEEAINKVSQTLCGPIECLEALGLKTVNDLSKVFKLARNFTFKRIHFWMRSVTNELGSLILAFARNHSNIEISIYCTGFEMADTREFVNQLYSLTERGIYASLGDNTTYTQQFLGESNAYWHQWVLQKLDDGCEFKYNVDKAITKETVTLNEVGIWNLYWHKSEKQ